MKQIRRRSIFIRSLASCALLSLYGCGGGSPAGGTGSGGAQRGALKVTVQWPAARSAARSAGSRLIPADTVAIGVKATTDDGTEVRAAVLARPPAGVNTTSSTLDQLPVGHVTVTATAFPAMFGANPGGTPQATGSISATVVFNQTVQTPPLVMNTTITNLAITPPSPTLMAGGAPATLSVTANDKDGNAVMTVPSNFQWVSDNANVVAVTPNGATASIQGKSAGTAHIRVTESESGVVSAPLAIVVSPAPVAANILIVDTGNDRIVGLDALPASSFTVFDGTQGGGTKLFDPTDATFDSQGRIYIANYMRAIIRVDDLNGTNRTELAIDPTASTIYLDSAGKLYWRDDSIRINRADDMTGANHVSFADTGLGAPSAIVTDSQHRIYASDGSASRIFRFDDMTGANKHFFGSDGTHSHLALDFFGRALAIDSADRLYIADFFNHRIVRIDPTALDSPTNDNWVEFDIPANGSGQNFYPRSVSVTSGTNPTIYFTGVYRSGDSQPDTDTGAFKMDDMTGMNLVRYGALGTGTGQFRGANAIVTR